MTNDHRKFKSSFIFLLMWHDSLELSDFTEAYSALRYVYLTLTVTGE